MQSLTSLNALARRPPGYWTNQGIIREFFIDFAKKKEIDPLNPDSWYNIHLEDVEKEVFVVLIKTWIIFSIFK